MNTKFHKSILSAALLLGFATMSSNAFATDKSTQAVIDAKHESQIWTTYALSSNLRANNLEVKVHKGKATLTGKVAEEIDKN